MCMALVFPSSYVTKTGGFTGRESFMPCGLECTSFTQRMPATQEAWQSLYILIYGVYIYIYVCVYVYMYIYTYMRVYIHMYTQEYAK